MKKGKEEDCVHLHGFKFIVLWRRKLGRDETWGNGPIGGWANASPYYSSSQRMLEW